jgi:hypothetical protein
MFISLPLQVSYWAFMLYPHLPFLFCLILVFTIVVRAIFTVEVKQQSQEAQSYQLLGIGAAPPPPPPTTTLLLFA